MIVGSGLLAKAFNSYFNKSEDYCVFASGVSNSTCSDQVEFDREQNYLEETLRQYHSADLFLYFSTCSAHGLLINSSPYIRHKLHMEQLVRKHPRYLVIRLPQIAGKTTNPNTLLSFIYSRISNGKRIQVWAKARRNIIDVDDVVKIVHRLAIQNGLREEVINVANFIDIATPDLVNLMAKIIEKEAIIDLVDVSEEYAIDIERIRSVVSHCGISFDSGYVERVLQKYYGKIRNG